MGNMCAKIKCPRYARFDELNQRLTGQKGLQEAAARVCSLPRIRSPMFTVGYGTVARLESGYSGFQWMVAGEGAGYGQRPARLA